MSISTWPLPTTGSGTSSTTREAPKAFQMTAFIGHPSGPWPSRGRASIILVLPMPGSLRISDAALNEQLGDFLRSRRERLSPEAAGLPVTRRRRTPGLRREEVAALAGIGVDWYIRLEQGRCVSP